MVGRLVLVKLVAQVVPLFVMQTFEFLKSML